jgi:hypothetical protein
MDNHKYFRNTCGPNDAVVNASDCYPKGVDFDSQLMHGFFLDEKEEKRLRTLYSLAN